MNTHGTKTGQIAAMVIFAFSCFGLLLFLWLSFGGSIPLKPKGYRFNLSFPEATTLADEADVRVSGVSVGKVTQLELDPAGNRTLATVEVDTQFAPVNKDAKAILRQKTLLGETYIEMTLGHKQAGQIAENAKLDNSRVAPSVTLDEVLETFSPKTRRDFQRWQASSAEAIKGRGQDLNSALGNIGGFSDEGASLLTILDRNAATVQGLVANTANVFEALTRDEGQLRAFIADSNTWLQATASQNEALADSIQILPTFLRESRTTLTRLERFAVDTKPLVDDLGPVARDLQPTLADLRRTAPDLQNFFTALPAAISASKAGLPAFSKVLVGLKPVLNATGPFLAQLNPILQWLVYQQGTAANFISMPGWALQDKASNATPGANGHILPQLIVAGSQSIVTPTRTSDNRGNAYFGAAALNGDTINNGFFTAPSWDCGNTTVHKPTSSTDPGCLIADDQTFKGTTQHYTQVLSSDFSLASGQR